MLTDDLFDSVLINPAEGHERSKLQIVSGFATASMAHRHLEHLAERRLVTSVELIVGMTGRTGIERAQHLAFCELAREQPYGLEFSCRYIPRGTRAVHAKTYLWSNGSVPFTAFCGSANYTVNGFLGPQTEAVTSASPSRVSDFFRACLSIAVVCRDQAIVDHVDITESRRISDDSTEDMVKLSLLVKRTNETHRRAGLNWGQREGRNPDQAYIPVPSRHYDFFPDVRKQFTVLTDDEFPMIFVRAQQRGKGLETPQSNALLGLYFRKRLGLQSGEYVTRQHLLDYGRTDVTFVRIDDETYLMDFSPNVEREHELESQQP